MRIHGTLAKWNAERGFGFISPAGGGSDVFVHISAFRRGGPPPQVGDLLSFEKQQGPDGKPKAVLVQRPGEATRARKPPEKPTRQSFDAVRAIAVVAVIGAIVWAASARFQKPLISPDAPASASLAAAVPRASPYKCDGRTHCSQMSSCEEAEYFLRNCPGTKMDGDNDGVPCETQLCN